MPYQLYTIHHYFFDIYIIHMLFCLRLCLKNIYLLPTRYGEALRLNHSMAALMVSSRRCQVAMPWKERWRSPMLRNWASKNENWWLGCKVDGGWLEQWTKGTHHNPSIRSSNFHSICPRLENRTSKTMFFAANVFLLGHICGGVGVGWDDNIHCFLHTCLMLRNCPCAHALCYAIVLVHMQGWKDVMCFSKLPVLRMPLYHIFLVVQAWFGATKPPSLSDLGASFGYSSQRCGVLRRVTRALLVAEARCAETTQAKRKLSGLDIWKSNGTSLKEWLPLGSTTNYYHEVFGVTVRDRPQINLQEFGTVAATNFGKPPTESLAKFESCRAADAICRTGTVVISDGCPAYVPCRTFSTSFFIPVCSVWYRLAWLTRLTSKKVLPYVKHPL